MVKEIKVNNEYEVTIDKQDHFGKGITKIDNCLVFVDKVLPTEKVKIEITRKKKNFAEAKVKELINSSKNRVKADCPYYNFCGGCQIMHQDYESQLLFKKHKVQELFLKFAKIEDIKINSIFSGNVFNYRNKVVFHGSGNKLGFYQEKSNKLVRIDECLLADDRINELYKKLKMYLINSSDVISKVMIRKTEFGESMLVIDGKVNKKRFLDYFKEDNIDSIYLNSKLILGNEYITENVFGKSFRLLPQAFFQVNYQMMEKLYKKVIDFYKRNNYENILDLYCGTGTIGILLSSYVKRVIGVEVIEDAVISANMNKDINDISNIEFILGKVEDRIEEFKNIDSVVIDPPRSGLDKITIKTLLNLMPKSIVYISCDPVTLARDLKDLLTKYDLVETNIVDMFPNTNHVESVVLLQIKN